MDIEVGDWVKITNPKWEDEKTNKKMKDKIVKIIHISLPFYKFKDDDSYLRSTYREEFELYRPVLKMFLKEKKNG